MQVRGRDPAARTGGGLGLHGEAPLQHPGAGRCIRVETLADADVTAAVKAAEDSLGDSGRILVRQSGTEPVIRVMAEAESAEVCRKCVDGIVDVIRAKGYCKA